MAGEDRFEVHEGVGEGREVKDLFPSVIFFVAAVSMVDAVIVCRRQRRPASDAVPLSSTYLPAM